MREVISKVGLVDFKSCWSVIRENGISKLLEWNNALLEVISKVGLVDLMAVRMRDEGEWDNPKVKPAVVKEKPADVTSKVSKGKELDVLKYKRKIEKESNALDNPNESDKGPVSESHEIQSESHEIQSESHVNHMEMQRKTKPDVVKAPVSKDNHMGFKMNYMEGQELNEITCDCRRITWDSR
ncbi:hypothetical protein Tco_0514282 [Tanacetum coccineum]